VRAELRVVVALEIPDSDRSYELSSAVKRAQPISLRDIYSRGRGDCFPSGLIVGIMARLLDTPFAKAMFRGSSASC